MVDVVAVQTLLASWWYVYDAGDFGVWPGYFTDDARFTCRSDSGETAFEEFIRADVSGGEQVVAWQVDHRRDSPYPLRHMATNVHLSATRPGEADFRSYLFVTQIVGGAVSNVSTGVVHGTVRDCSGDRGSEPRFAALHVVLDFTDSVTFTDATRSEPA